MTFLRVFLVVCVLVVVGASADASASSPDTGTWTLNVTFAGLGTGFVTTSPDGIFCTNEGIVDQELGICSAQFPVDVTPTVIVTTSDDSVVRGFTNCGPLEKQPRYVCGTGESPTGPTSVQVTLKLRSDPCTVVRVVGQPLARAKRNLRQAGCKVGTVRYAYSRSNINVGKVISQNPKAHWQLPRGAHGAVDLVVSKGRRRP
jgi:hypothetical protein